MTDHTQVTPPDPVDCTEEESRQSVLLVDDNPANLQVLFETVRGLCGKVLVARNGHDALNIVRRSRCDVVLLDVMMPGMDGYETCRRMKADPELRTAAVIFVSALDETIDKVTGFEAGGVDYITKPFEPAEVIARVSAHLRIRGLERRLARRAQHLEVQQTHILGAMDEGLYGLDTDGSIIYANPAALRMGGWDETEILGSTVAALHRHGGGRDVAGSPQPWPDATFLRSGRTLRVEEGVFRRSDGAPFPVQYTVSPLVEDGAVAGGVMVFRDITARREAEDRLRSAHEALQGSYRRLEQAQQQLVQAAKLESVGRLAAGVAHEVKNPLAIIQMGVDFLAAGTGTSPVVVQVLEDMEDAVGRADAVIKGLLNLSREQEAERGLHDLNDVIRRALGLVRHEMVQRNIVVEQDLQGDPALVLVDPPRMEQVFINLFMNAAQAMDRDGALSVRTRTRELQPGDLDGAGTGGVLQPGERVVAVQVRDSGPGMDPDTLERIFDPFYTTKPPGEGTGLGMSVTLSIVERHRATINIRNRKAHNGLMVTLCFRAQEESA